MNSSNKCLTIEEKRKLAMEGKSIPICVYGESFIDKFRRKRQQKRKAKIFNRNI